MKYNPDVVIDYYRERSLDLFPEYKFHPDRDWRFDFANPDLMLAIEVDGGVFIGGRHSRGAGMVKDFEKLNEATALGWRVLRTIPQNICMDDFADTVIRTSKGCK
jgi:very-short-patch-repair endonuclease